MVGSRLLGFDLVTAVHEAYILNYFRNANSTIVIAGLLLVDHNENSHPDLPLILSQTEKQDRHFIVFIC